jgi:hypothetical protein
MASSARVKMAGVSAARQNQVPSAAWKRRKYGAPLMLRPATRNASA